MKKILYIKFYIIVSFRKYKIFIISFTMNHKQFYDIRDDNRDEKFVLLMHSSMDI